MERKEYMEQWREKNKVRIQKYNKQQHIQNYKKNKEKIKEQTKKYRESHKKYYQDYNKKYGQDNKGHLSIQSKKYREDHKAELQEYFKARWNRDKKQLKVKNKINYEKNKIDICKKQKEYAKSHPEVAIKSLRNTRAKFPEKWRARAVTSRRIKKYKLKELQPYCLKCGKVLPPRDIQAHHLEYYPNNIAILGFCGTCHREIEKFYPIKSSDNLL